MASASSGSPAKMSRMNIGRRNVNGDGFRHGIEQGEKHGATRLQRGRIAPVRPVPLAPGAEKAGLHAENHVAILPADLADLPDVPEDSVHVLRVGAVIPAREAIREPDDHLQPVLTNRRECPPKFVELLRAEIQLLESLQVDLDSSSKVIPRSRRPSSRPIRLLMRDA